MAYGLCVQSCFRCARVSIIAEAFCAYIFRSRTSPGMTRSRCRGHLAMKSGFYAVAHFCFACSEFVRACVASAFCSPSPTSTVRPKPSLKKMEARTARSPLARTPSGAPSRSPRCAGLAACPYFHLLTRFHVLCFAVKWEGRDQP